MRNAVVVIGSQWGDEGKGKITNYLSQKADVVVRYQGGDNAGHTIQFLGNTYALHVIPSGVFNSRTKNVLGNGVVFNPKTFLEEVKNLKDKIQSPSKKVSADDERVKTAINYIKTNYASR